MRQPFQHSRYCPALVSKARACICGKHQKPVAAAVLAPEPWAPLRSDIWPAAQLECVAGCGASVIRSWCGTCGVWQDGKAPV